MKTQAKRVLGPLYGRLVRVRHSETMRLAAALAGVPLLTLRQRADCGLLSVDIARPMGMGAIISKALLFHHHAELRGLAPDIVATSALYGTGEDVLGQYFDRPQDPSGPTGSRMRGLAYDSLLHLKVDPHVPLEQAARLFERHFRPRPSISDKVAQVMDAAGGGFDFALHFRGTDKVYEATSVAHRTFADAMEAPLAALPGNPRVFLATDDPGFEAYVRQRFASIAFATFNLGTAEADVGRHFSGMRPEDKAVEAIVNIFLLTAAPLLIRTSSYLSAVSKIANPTLRTVTLNRTIGEPDRFPETEVLAAEAAHA